MRGTAMSDGRVRQLATAAVLLVAAIAAVVSYIHVESLAATHGQDWLAARLEPLSVDGTVARPACRCWPRPGRAWARTCCTG